MKEGLMLGKYNIFSFVFVFITVAINFLPRVTAMLGFMPNHSPSYLLFTAIIVIVSPILGVITGLFGKNGMAKDIALVLNVVFFVQFSLFEMLYLWTHPEVFSNLVNLIIRTVRLVKYKFCI